MGTLSGPGDRVSLLGLCFHGHHGLHPWEQELGQAFEVDMEVELDLSGPGHTDRLGAGGVDYVRLYQVAKDVIEGPRHKLLEFLAENIADRALDLGDVAAVTVRLRKPRAALPGACGVVQVEIRRARP